MKILVCIIIYNRLHNLKTWLKCWQESDHYGAELVILHTGDGPEYKQLCDEYGIKYVHRQNQGVDIGATQDVFRERLEGFPNDWDYLLWVTDDVIPMSKDFVRPFIQAMKPGVGVTCMKISDAISTHVRTVAYCIGKELSRKINFPTDPVLTKDQALMWEHRAGRDTFTNQVHRAGLRCIQITPDEVSPLWDTGYGKRLERMGEHYKVFPPQAREHTIHHFYHIYADGKWQEPVTEHLRAMKMGLLDQLTTFNIGIVGHPRNRLPVKQFLVEQGIYFNIIAQANTGWEQITQIPMWEFSQNNEGLILYAHTKGAHDPNEVNIRWRRSMTYWDIVRWKDCVGKLKDHEMVGTHWIYPTLNMPEHKYGNPMMGGTFYWVRAEQMRTWESPPLTHRWEAEGWCGYRYVKKPWLIWDWTPYFPNTNHFADSWVDDPNFIGADTGKTIPAEVLHDKQVAE